MGCATPPPALLPVPTQVQGLAVVPQTVAGENALGRKQPLIIQDHHQQAILFSVLEMNKTDAPTSNVDVSNHDFVVKWKLQNQEGMDRSQLYLRLSSPHSFVYESDLGSSTKKYTIKTNSADAKKVWGAIGITPAEL